MKMGSVAMRETKSYGCIVPTDHRFACRTRTVSVAKRRRMWWSCVCVVAWKFVHLFGHLNLLLFAHSIYVSMHRQGKKQLSLFAAADHLFHLIASFSATCFLPFVCVWMPCKMVCVVRSSKPNQFATQKRLIQPCWLNSRFRCWLFFGINKRLCLRPRYISELNWAASKLTEQNSIHRAPNTTDSSVLAFQTTFRLNYNIYTIWTRLLVNLDMYEKKKEEEGKFDLSNSEIGQCIDVT